MKNDKFLKILQQSFKKFLQTGSRSNEKLKILHGAIAHDIQLSLGSDYEVYSLGINKEAYIQGKYINKKVDITIKKDAKPVAGVGLKFVMQNYKQNSNNYFESMLGETANIRSAGVPYFQIFIIFDTIPYYNKKKEITHWEELNKHNMAKYITLSKDDSNATLHTPNKTLLYVVTINIKEPKPRNKEEYAQYCLQNLNIKSSSKFEKDDFTNNVIYNNYEDFIQKITHHVTSI